MGVQTPATRAAALSILETRGISWTRVGRGQRFVIHLEISGRPVRALVKVASLGSVMVRTDREADDAKISGFKSDVDHVLFAVGRRASAAVEAYLVPIAEVDAAYRSAYRAWRSTHEMKAENRTWVLRFDEYGTLPECDRFSEKWARYLVGTTEQVPRIPSVVGPDAHKDSVVENAKQIVAAGLGVAIEKVKIIVEY
jgi:hypothetical protein